MSATTEQPKKPFKVAPIASKGFGVGTNDHYDKARPSYPPAALQYIHSLFPTSPATSPTSKGLNIVELGSGTGLFSRLLIHPPPLGPLSVTLPKDTTAHDIQNKSVDEFVDEDGFKIETKYPDWEIESMYAVEPSEGMRGTWETACAGAIEARSSTGATMRGEIVTIDGGFSDLTELKERLKSKGDGKNGSGKGWADLVIIAQAYHWADPNYEEAIAEIASVLKPSGLLIFIWNTEDRRPPYPPAMFKFETSLEDDTPQQRLGKWRKTFETEAYRQNFKPQEEQYFRWDAVMSDQKIVDRVFSKSYVSYRSEKEKEEIRQRLWELLGEWKDHEWVNKEDGTYLTHFSTHVVVMERK